MSPLFARILVPIAMALAAATPLNVQAGGLSEAEAKQVQTVIVTQLAAFAQDDADSAFATATPAVREAIGNPGRFLALVRGAYPMVYSPSSVTFHKPEETEGSVLQMVEITDSSSKSWLALFALEKQPDASWRISGCVVAENKWKSA
jgi:hypothetical protein